MTKLPDLNVELREIPNLPFLELKNYISCFIIKNHQRPPPEKSFLYGVLPTACRNCALAD